MRTISLKLDANGRAVKNGIQGNSSTLLDLRMQYIATLPGNQTVGLFWEVFNALNKQNLGNPTGNRNNRNFMIPVEAGTIPVRHLRRVRRRPTARPVSRGLSPALILVGRC